MTTASPGGHDPTEVGASEQQKRGRIPSDTFGNRLVLARRLEGLTIREAAERCGLHYATWSTWEAGRRPADILDVTTRIADELDIDRDWLLFGGPLLPARGRPVKRPNRSTDRYSRVALCPAKTGTNGLTRTGATAQAVRRSNVIVRSHPAAA